MTYKLVLFILGLTMTFFSFAQTNVKLKKEGSIYLIPCKVNGLDFEFYFDTGASLVSLSLNEANILIEDDRLSKNDIIGKTQMTIANGEFMNGTIILLKELKIGDLVLNNVEAVISESQTAPLLLGQSAIRRFGEFSFDYDSEILSINIFKKKSQEESVARLNPAIAEGLTPSEQKSYSDFFENKQKIIENLNIELVKCETQEMNNDNYVSLSFDITNNSDYDFFLSKQLMATPPLLVNIVATVFTSEGKTYTGKAKLTDLPTGNTLSTNDSFIYINIRKNNITGIKIRVLDLHH